MHLFKKISVLTVITCICIGIAGCGKAVSKNTVGSITDWDMPQFYKTPSVAEAENGSYYYIANYPMSMEKIRLLYYYDNNNNISYPLCSNTSCDHSNTSCDAYMSDDECIDNMIWYYKDRIYMIEQTSEYDNLVSYDKRGRDKKVENQLSVNGLSVGSSSVMPRFCVNNGKLFYTIAGQDMIGIYKCSLDKKEEPVLITQYSFENEHNQIVSLCSRQGKVYINRKVEVNSDSVRYCIDSVNKQDNKVDELISFDNNLDGVRGDISDWNRDICYDDEDNFYFTSIYDDEFIVNKLNIKSSEVSEFYVLEGKGNTEKNRADTDYCELAGFNGKNIILYQGVNISVKEKGNNYIYMLGKDGNLTDTIELARNNDKSIASYYIAMDYLGVINNKLIITTSRFDIDNAQITDEWYTKYNELITADRKKQPRICMILMCDLEQDNKSWRNITYNMFK